mmetsp:Transcript_10366/g.26574  ORF Transcript_10366/g.26574 Transcript_10366/m.26574 type:complete len:337 (-) Transcript_10366:1716-2726(-)
MIGRILGCSAICATSRAAKSFRLNMKPSGSRSGSSYLVSPSKAIFSVMIFTFFALRLLRMLRTWICTIMTSESIRSMSPVSRTSMPLAASTSGSIQRLSHSTMTLLKCSSGSCSSCCGLSGSPWMCDTLMRLTLRMLQSSSSAVGCERSYVAVWSLNRVTSDPTGSAARPRSNSLIVSAMKSSSAAPITSTRSCWPRRMSGTLSSSSRPMFRNSSGCVSCMPELFSDTPSSCSSLSIAPSRLLRLEGSSNTSPSNSSNLSRSSPEPSAERTSSASSVIEPEISLGSTCATCATASCSVALTFSRRSSRRSDSSTLSSSSTDCFAIAATQSLLRSGF